jgi:hypothetical protein
LPPQVDMFATRRACAHVICGMYVVCCGDFVLRLTDWATSRSDGPFCLTPCTGG